MSTCTDSMVFFCERIVSCAGNQFRSRASESEGYSATRYYAECPNQPLPVRQNRLAQAVGLMIYINIYIQYYLTLYTTHTVS